MIYSLASLILLVIDILIIIRIFQSSRPPEYKLLWILVILFLPILGLVLYLLLADRTP